MSGYRALKVHNRDVYRVPKTWLLLNLVTPIKNVLCLIGRVRPFTCMLFFCWCLLGFLAIQATF